MTGPSLCCRRELPADLEAIRAVETAAFGRTNEARLVDSPRAAGALTFPTVADVDAKIVGHVAYSPIKIESGHSSLDAVALAPLAVLPEWQRRGIASALVRWSLGKCRRGRHELVIVIGHAEYYPRFGFCPGDAAWVSLPI